MPKEATLNLTTRYLSNLDSFWSAVHIVFLISVSNNISNAFFCFFLVLKHLENLT